MFHIISKIRLELYTESLIYSCRMDIINNISKSLILKFSVLIMLHQSSE
nr:hypothetical protein BAR15_120159 [Bartonella sp. AR 15-3]